MHDRIEIGLKKEAGEIHISMRDDGIALPSDFDASGSETMGTMIVNDLTGQLDGKLNIYQGDSY